MDASDDDDEHDELTDAGDVPGEFTDDEVDYRERAAAKLDHIVRQTKQGLVEAAIDIDVFFLIPSGGTSILIFGTPGDPSDREWHRVAEIVEPIVRQSVGLDRTRRRPIICASTEPVAESPAHGTSSPAD